MLSEESRDQALALSERRYRTQVTIAVPHQFPVEVTNIVPQRVARRHLSIAEGRQLLGAFTRFVVQIVIPGNLVDQAQNLSRNLFPLPCCLPLIAVATPK